MHSIPRPLALVRASVCPPVESLALSSVVSELTRIDISILPMVGSLAFFFSSYKIAFVPLASGESQLAEAVLQIILPLAIVNITIIVLVPTVKSVIIFKLSFKLVAVV